LSFAGSVVRLVSVLRSSLRGLFGRSFQRATVPLPVPSWTPADRKLRPRSGAIRPTLLKSIRSSRGTPRRSIIVFTPGRNGQVQGTSRAGVEPQGFARLRRRINTVTKVDWVSPLFGRGCYTSTTLRGGQGNGGNRPERRARARRGTRVGHRVHPCSLRRPAIPL